MGIAVPNEYAKVIKNADSVTSPLKASEITEASIGPTHGVHKSPMLIPIKIPPKKPSLPVCLGENLDNLANNFSSNSLNFGTKKDRPKRKITITEKLLNESAET